MAAYPLRRDRKGIVSVEEPGEKWRRRKKEMTFLRALPSQSHEPKPPTGLVEVFSIRSNVHVVDFATFRNLHEFWFSLLKKRLAKLISFGQALAVNIFPVLFAEIYDMMHKSD